MKEIIRNRLPYLYGICKGLYEKTAYYKNTVNNLNKLKKVTKEQRQQEENRVMIDVFDDNYIVRNGPFKGMKYIRRASGSAFLPKILGSYEEPIQKWVNEVIEDKKYNHILDIGAAEGYYACGFAMTLPNINVMAYEIDKEARENIEELKAINNLHNIEIKSECTFQELNDKSKENTLIFCDIEGFEDVLLDPVRVPNLENVDLIIESHDFILPNITDELIKRFYMTHIIKIIVNYPYRVKSYEILNKVSKEDYKYIIDERRPEYMKFIYMEHTNGKI